MSNAKWTEDTIEIAHDGGNLHWNGWTYAGLGLIFEDRVGWHLLHVNSGHRLALLEVTETSAFEIGTTIAECGDWDFAGLTGHQNMDPDLPDRAFAILKKMGVGVTPDDGQSPSQDIALEITRNRMN